MRQRSKRYVAESKLVDRNKTYELDEALALVKQTSKTKFDAAVEVHIRLGIDPKKSDQFVRAAVILPHGTGKKLKIAVVAEEGKQKEAKDAGAYLVGGKELIEEIKKTSRCDFDIMVATPDMMKELAQVAKVLGPKGLMPSPKSGTVTPDVKKAVEELNKGKVEFKNDEFGNLHQIIGKLSWDVAKIKENFDTLFDAIKRAKPSGLKGTYIKSITVTGSMGPGVKVKL